MGADRTSGSGRRRFLCGALVLASAGAGAETPQPPQAPEFSADIVTRDAAGAALGTGGKLHVAKGKVRIETSDVSSGFFIIDGAAATALFVRPAQQVFMDARQSSRVTRIFLPVDPGGPCSKWQAAAQNAGVPNANGNWQCERVATAPVEGRSTVEYTVVSPDRDSSQRWIDSDLEFPVKVRMSDGTILALEHIQVAAQPASLFALPAGYLKSDPQALVNRIKQSDVWVEPPK